MNSDNERICQNAVTPQDNETNAVTEAIHGLDDFESLWKLAFNASSDMISILDNHHRIVAVNSAAAEMMGCAPKEAVSRKCHHLLHHTDSPPLHCPHRALLEDGKAHRTEYYEERLNLWLQVNVTPLYNRQNELVGCIHIARDITQHKRSEQAQRESEERYHHLSEATVEGVLLSEESTIIAANQVLADMLGYSVKKMIGMDLLDLVPPAHHDRIVKALQTPASNTISLESIRKDGTVFPIEAHARAITYRGKMVYQTAIRDLTEQQRIEQERIAHERLRGVLEMAGAVCHEINQPLMALQGYMEIISSESVSTDQNCRALQRMEKQIERIRELSHKLMHVTTYETKDYAGGQKIIDLEQASSNNGAHSDRAGKYDKKN